MSRKTIAFSRPASAPREQAGGARLRGGSVAGAATTPDAWVARSDPPDADAGPATSAPKTAILIDLAAERPLIEALALSLLVPFALGWFWFAHVMTGRIRF